MLDKKELLEEDDIVTLYSPEGEAVKFVEIAGIVYKGSFYVLLQPLELPEGMSGNEALVFKVSRTENGEDKFEIVLDDSIVDAVYAKYNKLLNNTES